MLLHRFTEHELKERAGATIPIGGAGLIVAYPKSSAEKVRTAVKRAISITVGTAEGNRLQALTGALADAQRRWPPPTPETGPSGAPAPLAFLVCDGFDS